MGRFRLSNRMELKTDLPNEIKADCQALMDRLSDIEKVLEPVIDMDQSARNKLAPLDQAKIELVSVYSMNSLAWLYQITNGIDPRQTSLPDELKRIQGNMQRVKAIEDKAKRVGVNSAAAKRVVKHELHQFKAKKQKTDQ